jgi:hypothetical protein
MSIADFKKNYWITTLNNKVSYLERNIKDESKQEELNQNLELLRNEISKELESESGRIVKFDQLDNLYLDKINDETIKALKKYFDILNRYYIKLYNKANSYKDNLISDLQKTPEDRKSFMTLKRRYHNENLSELLRNSNEINRIIEYNGELFQKIDPIYLDPQNNLIKAHFYAPRKQVFGKYYDTFWVNIMVIWLMAVLLYVVLYFRLLKKALDFFEEKRFKVKKP